MLSWCFLGFYVVCFNNVFVLVLGYWSMFTRLSLCLCFSLDRFSGSILIITSSLCLSVSSFPSFILYLSQIHLLSPPVYVSVRLPACLSLSLSFFMSNCFCHFKRISADKLLRIRKIVKCWLAYVHSLKQTNDTKVMYYLADVHSPKKQTRKNYTTLVQCALYMY